MTLVCSGRNESGVQGARRRVPGGRAARATAGLRVAADRRPLAVPARRREPGGGREATEMGSRRESGRRRTAVREGLGVR